MVMAVVLFNIISYLQVNQTDITVYEWLGLRTYRLLDATLLPFVLLIILYMGPFLYGIYYIINTKSEFDAYICINYVFIDQDFLGIVT